ncbi:GntR family transcriptional regulator [Opitutaceae bacterium TAV5]|nr:GntR family transcriptional regulator [Opitutaceae bacterium TAV5]
MPATSTTSASSSRSKLEAVYELLKGQIADGKWQVGEQIPTEVELARELDCSRSTMGMAISRLAHDGLVERKTRAGTRVLRATPARSVAAPSSAAPAVTPVQLDAFAFIYSSELHEGIFRTVQGFQLAARERNRRVVTLTTGTDYHKEAEFISRLAEFDVKGAVINPLVSTVQEQMFFTNALRTSSVPVVLAGTTLPGSGRPCALADNFHAGYTLTRHLIDRGLRKIGFFANHAWAHFISDRHQGYRWALKEAGLTAPEATVCLEEARHVNFTDPLAEPTALARAWLSRVEAGGFLADLEAVVCADDILAIGLIHAALEKGLRVPRDLKVTGLGDFALQPPEGITLTTYRVPYETIGLESFHLLEASLAARSASQPNPANILLEGQLVIRSSTA